MSDVMQVIRAAVEMLGAAIFEQKQLIGERGLADDLTDEYQTALLLVLAEWIRRNSSLRIEDRFALEAAVAELNSLLEETALEHIPEAFAMGFGGLPPDPERVLESGDLLNLNRQFVEGSLAPYLIEDMTSRELPGLTIGRLAQERAFAWESRLSLYAGAFWTAIWVGMGSLLRERVETDTIPVRRLLDPQAEHCGTCPGKAGEYDSWNEMLAFTGGLPADGSDECVSNCRCQIELFIEGEWVGVG